MAIKKFSSSSAGFKVQLAVLVVLACIARTPDAAFTQIGPGTPYLLNRWLSSVEPSTAETDREINNWLDVGYKYSYWRAGLRVEFHDPRNPEVYNDKITQRYVMFKKDWLRIRAGSFYERLGRGLVFHAFEIQSQTLNRTDENIAIDRNIDGANIKLSFDNVDVTGIWGRPLKMFSSDRGHALGGGEVRFRPFSALLLGGTFLRFSDDFLAGVAGLERKIDLELSSLQVGLSLGSIDLHTEISQKKSADESAIPSGNALYATANYSGDSFGLSAEFKRYEDFNTDFNNPPALVKTHSFTLLNRHTHSLNPNDEIGYQFESYFSPNLSTTITLHASGADNLENNERQRFREYFFESRQEWGEQAISRVLIDYSKDRLLGDLNRWTFASEVDYLLNDRNSLLFDAQLQNIDNENNLNGKYWNMLGLLAFSRSPFMTLSAQYEHTTNAFSGKSNWFSGTLNLKVGQHHDVILTAGSRPAGLVCSGGICFQVPEFAGVELRWNARF